MVYDLMQLISFTFKMRVIQGGDNFFLPFCVISYLTKENDIKCCTYIIVNFLTYMARYHIIMCC